MSVLVKGMEKPEHCGYCRFRYDGICHALQRTQYSMDECPLIDEDVIKAQSSAQPEPFTDEEQRIFLLAMVREELVCKHVDAVNEDPYEDSLVRICHEITRKVKGALWT